MKYDFSNSSNFSNKNLKFFACHDSPFLYTVLYENDVENDLYCSTLILKISSTDLSCIEKTRIEEKVNDVLIFNMTELYLFV